MRIISPPEPADARVRLRALEAGDIDDWFACLSIPEVVERTSWNVRAPDELAALLERYDSPAADSDIRFAILSAHGAFLGTVGFHSISGRHRTAEIAYDLVPWAWGQGVATTCCAAVTDWGFGSQGYVRIDGAVLESNLRSIRVLHKCGYLRDVTRRDRRLVRGIPRDFLLYSRTGPSQYPA